MIHKKPLKKDSGLKKNKLVYENLFTMSKLNKESQTGCDFYHLKGEKVCIGKQNTNNDA